MAKFITQVKSSQSCFRSVYNSWWSIHKRMVQSGSEATEWEDGDEQNGNPLQQYTPNRKSADKR